MCSLVGSSLCNRDLDIDKTIDRDSSFEMWIWSRMTKISWMDKISSTSKWDEKYFEYCMVPETSLDMTLFWGHDELLCNLLEGIMAGLKTYI